MAECVIDAPAYDLPRRWLSANPSPLALLQLAFQVSEGIVQRPQLGCELFAFFISQVVEQ